MRVKRFNDSFGSCKERALDCLSYLHHVATDDMKPSIERAYRIISGALEHYQYVRWGEKGRKSQLYSETLPEMFDIRTIPPIPPYEWRDLHCYLVTLSGAIASTTYYFSTEAYLKYTADSDFEFIIPLGNRVGMPPTPAANPIEPIDQEEYCPICDCVGTHSLTCFNRKR